MDDVKIYNKNSHNNSKNAFKNAYQIKIIKLGYFPRDIKAQAYVLKKDKDNFNYLAELPLVNNEYGFKDTICYLYDELSEENKEKYKEEIDTIFMKYPDVKLYDRPKSWSKKKTKKR